MINAKLNQQRFWPCCEKKIVKTFQRYRYPTTYVRVLSPVPQKGLESTWISLNPKLRDDSLKLTTRKADLKIMYGLELSVQAHPNGRHFANAFGIYLTLSREL